MPNPLLAERVLIHLTQQEPSYDRARLEILFRDFVASATAGSAKYNGERKLFSEGMAERGAHLGLLGSADDLDDVDWKALTHPGSIIWPVAIASGVALKTLLTAAAWGYRTSATIAHLFGATHRERWHVTSTSGAFAATTTASIALGLTPAEHLKALKLCAMNIGASSQAGFERLGAAQFNRAAAISLGVASAKAAVMNVVSVEDIWNSPRGLIELFSVEAQSDEILDGLSTTALRLLPTNGFAHSAVIAAWELVQELNDPITAITVYLPQAAKGLLDESLGGTWWNCRFGVAAVCESKDVTNLTSAKKYLAATQSKFIDIPIGSGQVKITTTRGEYERYIDLPPERKEWVSKKLGSCLTDSLEDLYLRCSSFPVAALR